MIRRLVIRWLTVIAELKVGGEEQEEVVLVGIISAKVLH